MRKKPLLLLIASALVLCLAVSAAFAVWEDTRIALQTVPVKSEKWNESEKYIIFAALDNEGAFTSLPEETTALAVVGYTGIVSTLELPESTTVTIGDEERTFPVVSVKYPPTSGLRFQDGVTYSGVNAPLANNHVVIKLIVPATVENIDAYVFLGNKYLSELEIITKPSTEEVSYPTVLTLGIGAFSGCMELSTLKNDGGRVLDVGDNTMSAIFDGSRLPF